MTLPIICTVVAVLTGWGTYEVQLYAEQYVAAKHAND
jgi:hypothetical protein